MIFSNRHQLNVTGSMGCSSSNFLDSENNASQQNLPHFKIVLVGDRGAGKTSVFLRYIGDTFDKRYIATKISNSATVEKIVSDINGSDIHIALTLSDIPANASEISRQLSLKTADAAIVIVDLTDPDSITFCRTWKEDIISHARTSKQCINNKSTRVNITDLGIDNCSMPILLMGTKLDCIKSEDKSLFKQKHKQQASKCITDLEDIADKYNFFGSVLVSCKYKNGGVKEAFSSLIHYIISQKAESQMDSTDQNLLLLDSLPFEERNDTDHDHWNHKTSNLVDSLEQVGLPTFDFMINKINSLINGISKLASMLSENIQDFIDVCLAGKFISSSNISLKECLHKICLKISCLAPLGLIKSNDFPQIIVRDKNLSVPSLYFHYLKVFHEKVVSSCLEILNVIPIIFTSLTEISSKLTLKIQQIWNISIIYGKGMEDVKEILAKLNRNEERIQEGQNLAKQTLHKVEEIRKTIEKTISNS